MDRFIMGIVEKFEFGTIARVTLRTDSPADHKVLFTYTDLHLYGDQRTQALHTIVTIFADILNEHHIPISINKTHDGYQLIAQDTWAGENHTAESSSKGSGTALAEPAHNDSVAIQMMQRLKQFLAETKRTIEEKEPLPKHYSSNDYVSRFVRAAFIDASGDNGKLHLIRQEILQEYKKEVFRFPRCGVVMETDHPDAIKLHVTYPKEDSFYPKSITHFLERVLPKNGLTPTFEKPTITSNQDNQLFSRRIILPPAAALKERSNSLYRHTSSALAELKAVFDLSGGGGEFADRESILNECIEKIAGPAVGSSPPAAPAGQVATMRQSLEDHLKRFNQANPKRPSLPVNEAVSRLLSLRPQAGNYDFEEVYSILNEARLPELEEDPIFNTLVGNVMRIMNPVSTRPTLSGGSREQRL